MTRSEILPTATIIVNAGGGTTSDCLTAALYLILSNPTVGKRAVEEVRSTFKSESDITLASVGQLPFMNAIIEETLRFHPPAAGIFERRIDTEGEIIDGNFVPHNVRLIYRVSPAQLTCHILLSASISTA